MFGIPMSVILTLAVFALYLNDGERIQQRITEV
jgi:hypothetical protein